MRWRSIESKRERIEKYLIRNKWSKTERDPYILCWKDRLHKLRNFELLKPKHERISTPTISSERRKPVPASSVHSEIFLKASSL